MDVEKCKKFQRCRKKRKRASKDDVYKPSLCIEEMTALVLEIPTIGLSTRSAVEKYEYVFH